MELMRCLLLFSLTMLPWSLGISTVWHPQIKLDKSQKMINQKQFSRNKILLNINGPPLVNTVTELQSLFKDIACHNCTVCMERAMRTQKIHSHVINERPSAHELYYDLLDHNREKRNSESNTKAKIIQDNSTVASVTKYSNEDGKLFALEVKGIDEEGTKNYCKVYTVKKILPCDVDVLIPAITKRKIDKKSKKNKKVKVITERAKTIAPVFKKREVDNSEVLESSLPSSIEELLY